MDDSAVGLSTGFIYLFLFVLDNMMLNAIILFLNIMSLVIFNALQQFQLHNH